MAISADEIELDPPQPPVVVAAIAELLAQEAAERPAPWSIASGSRGQGAMAGVPRKSRGTDRA